MNGKRVAFATSSSAAAGGDVDTFWQQLTAEEKAALKQHHGAVIQQQQREKRQQQRTFTPGPTGLHDPGLQYDRRGQMPHQGPSQPAPHQPDRLIAVNATHAAGAERQLRSGAPLRVATAPPSGARNTAPAANPVAPPMTVDHMEEVIRSKIQQAIRGGPHGLQRAFRFVDKDGDGRIDAGEFRCCSVCGDTQVADDGVSCAGTCSRNTMFSPLMPNSPSSCAGAGVVSVFAHVYAQQRGRACRYDGDGNGTVDFKEFVALVLR